jgi:ATP-dependent Clp protease adaptor protein ClpS
VGAISTETDIQTKTKIKKPKKYAVYILNDDYTPWNFVVSTLIKIFNKTEEDANILTSSVHNSGEGLCGIYTKEIAESKVAAASEYAKINKQPLRTTMRVAD